MDLTVRDLAAIKGLYKKAVSAGDEQFKYKDTDILVAYAKYLIEYMETIMKGERG